MTDSTKRPFPEHKFTNGFTDEKSPEIALVSGDKILSVKRSFCGYAYLQTEMPDFYIGHYFLSDFLMG